MAERSIALRIAIRDVEESQRRLKALGVEGEAALERIAAGAPRASAALTSIDTAVAGTSRGMGRFGSAAQQAGYQIGDFAVQVQAGTNPLIALTQQGSQFLGMLGPWGAVVGAAGAVLGGLATAFLSTNAAAEETPSALEGAIASLGALESQINKVSEAYEKASAEGKKFLSYAAEEDVAKRTKQGIELAAQAAGSLYGRFQSEARERIRPLIEAGMLPEQEAPLIQGVNLEAARRVADLQARIEKALTDGKPDEVTRIALEAGVSPDIIQQLRSEASNIASTEALTTAGQINAAWRRGPPIYTAAPAAIGYPTPERRPEYVPRVTAANAAEEERLATERATAARQGSNDTLDRENRLRQAGITLLKDINRQRDEEQKRLEERQDYFSQMGEEFRQEQEKRAKDRQQQIEREGAERQREIEQYIETFTAPLERAVANLQDILADGIAQGLQDGFSSLPDLLEAFNSIGPNITAQLVSAFAVQPLQQGIQSLQAALNQAFQPGGGGLGAGLTRWAQANPLTAGLLGGQVAGSFVPLITGRQSPYSGIGSLLGGVAGTAALGPIGGIIGGAAGGFLGGLFGGGEQNLGNDRAGLHYQLGRGITWEDRSSSRENRQAIHRVASELDDVARLLARQGTAYTGPEFSFSAGNKTGYEFHFAQGGIATRTYASIEELIGGLIETIGDRVSGASATLATVLDNTLAQSAQELAEDIDFAKTFDRLIGDQSDLASAVEDLRENFADVAFRAKELGLATEELTKAQERAEKELIEEGVRELENAVRSSAGQIQDFIDSLVEPLQQATGPFGISAGIVAPQATVEAGLEQFREQLALARQDDISAIQNLPGLAQQVLQYAREYGASGAPFTEIFREINKGLLEIQGAQEERRDEILKSIPEAIELTAAETIAELRRGFDKVTAELEKTRKELEKMKLRPAA